MAEAAAIASQGRERGVVVVQVRRVRVAAAGALALAVALGVGSCTSGDGDDASTSPSSTTLPGDTATGAATALPEPTATPGQDDTASDGDASEPPFPANTEPDTGQATGPDVGTLTDLRVGGHDGFDRVVLELNGPDVPSWDVRYVPQAISDGRGDVVDVDGDAILEVALYPVAYPFDGTDPYAGPQVVSVAATQQVTEVVYNHMFEGYLQTFIGVDGGEQPFRAYGLTDPARVVIEVQHD